MIRTDKLDLEQVRGLDEIISSRGNRKNIIKILDGRQVDLIADPLSFKTLDSYLKRKAIPYQITDEDVYDTLAKVFNSTYKDADPNFRLDHYNSHTNVSLFVV